MTEINDAAPPHLQPCPGCGLTDRLVGVPAVYQGGRQQRTTRPARWAGEEPETTVTREWSPALSAALAPVPSLPVSPRWLLGALALFGSVVTFVVNASLNFGAAQLDDIRTDASAGTDVGFTDNPVLVGGSGSSSDPFYRIDPGPGGLSVHLHAATAPAHHQVFGILPWISALALLTAAVLFVSAARRRSAFRKSTAGSPAAEQVWSRGWYCERCGTAHFAATPGAPSRALSLREFRTTVWEAGGYGHLAQRIPPGRNPLTVIPRP
ncbi:hypothetical protein GCM10009760_22000 [Kitasatospora kazusensis]|uniref:Uncharacterized protein n=1 Tax=Kitasatospora kazusensis TaxID=407974 RepID=A0ABN2ZBA5_9ACTN